MSNHQLEPCILVKMGPFPIFLDPKIPFVGKMVQQGTMAHKVDLDSWTFYGDLELTCGGHAEQLFKFPHCIVIIPTFLMISSPINTLSSLILIHQVIKH